LVEGVDDGGVELDTVESPDLRCGIVDRPRVLVGASVGEGVEHIGERDDAGRERNPLAFQSVRVAVPVPAAGRISMSGGQGGGTEEVWSCVAFERRAAVGG
jgi:hypothetical protein